VDTVCAPDWLFWAKIGFLAAFAGPTLWWRALRRLRSYGLVLPAFFLALRMSVWVGSTAWWQDRFARRDVSFARGFAGVFLLDTGVAGVLMTGFLAWLIGKSMLETGGFLWPWFIHFVPDVVVFASYALLRVQP